MKRKTTNSPYPVLYPAGEEFLSEQGYGEASFDVAGDPEVSVDAVTHNVWIRFDFNLQEPTLAEMVEDGDAKYYVNIECGRTYYRKAVLQSESHFELEIPYQDISDSLEIFAGVTAARDIKGFRAAGFADKFGSTQFDIEEGDILAAATGWNVELEELDGDTTPYIYVARDESGDDHNELWIDGGGDELVVYLAQEIYDIYYGRAKDAKYKDLLIALVMKPAIFTALQEEIIRTRKGEDDETPMDTQGKRWLRKLDGLLSKVTANDKTPWDVNSIKIDEDREPNTLAFAVSKLLGRPLAKAMGNITKRL